MKICFEVTEFIYNKVNISLVNVKFAFRKAI